MNLPENFQLKNGKLLWCAQDLSAIAEEVGTPCYVYGREIVKQRFKAYDEPLSDIPHLICYAMKANSNLAVMRTLAELGSSVDIVSGGELFIARKAGFPPEKTVFSSVGKSREELREAVRAGILFFNVEVSEEVDYLSEIARQEGKTAGISVRINPDIDPGTHPYISTGLEMNKFGLIPEQAIEVYRKAARAPGLKILGIQSHIGSQICTLQPFIDTIDRLLELCSALQAEGISVKYLSVGGGLGIQYRDEHPPHPSEYAAALKEKIAGAGMTLLTEPGRSIVGPAGILLTKVLYRKQTPRKKFVIVDSAMNDLIRPSLYGSYHRILPVTPHDGPFETVDVVGPVCETGDFLAQDREMLPMQAGDLLAVCETGAYGYTMSSNYNARLRPPEVLIEDSGFRVVRTRQMYQDLVRGAV